MKSKTGLIIIIAMVIFFSVMVIGGYKMNQDAPISVFRFGSSIVLLLIITCIVCFIVGFEVTLEINKEEIENLKNENEELKRLSKENATFLKSTMTNDFVRYGQIYECLGATGDYVWIDSGDGKMLLPDCWFDIVKQFQIILAQCNTVC